MAASTEEARGHVSTRNIVADYIAHRLGQQRLPVPPGIARTTAPGDGVGGGGGGYQEKVLRSLKDLGEEVERRYADVYSDMCGSLTLTPANAEATFKAVAEQLFDGGTVNWGRIVALFAYCGALSAVCVQRDMEYLVEQVVNWTARFIDNRLQTWIDHNRGWDGLLEFYENSEGNQNGEWSWPGLSSLCGYVFSAVGMVTLSAVLSRK